MQGIVDSHAKYIGDAGIMSHDSKDGTSAGDRIMSVLHTRAAAENIAASSESSTAEDIVLQLVVDDGVPSRGHWTNIFNPELKYAAVGIAPHKVYGIDAVIDFAGELM